MQHYHTRLDSGLNASTLRRGKFGGDGRAAGQWRVLRGIVPYVWPADRPDLQATVLISLLLMLLAKIVTVTMPFAFKWATDALVAVAGGKLPAGQTWTWLAGAPVLATLVYGLTRIGMSLLGAGARRHVRQGCAACGAQARAQNFRAHAPAFPALPSGTQNRRAHPRARARAHRDRKHHAHDADDFVPTLVEFALVVGVLLYEFDWRYATVVVAMIAFISCSRCALPTGASRSGAT
jgi:ATP-binding cassette subfamily B protein